MENTMTDQTPLPGTETRMSDAAVIRARIVQHCEWFGTPQPKLKIRSGKIYLTDELHDWMRESGASFDWIFCGDAQGMASEFRKSCEDQRRLIEATK